jgi:hypothetical protein
MLLAVAVFALVTQDSTSLRASPSSAAPKNAVLWQGESLEIRGARAGYLQVWSYPRERGGYVLEGQVRAYPLETTRAAGVLEIVRLARDMPGLEALGIAHAALFLKLATPAEIDTEVFDALGTMAERLARRASWRAGRPGDDSLAAHLEVVHGYGVQLVSLDQDGRTQVCYDGDAYRRVLARRPTPEEQARAVLGLTRPECDSGAVAERAAAHEAAAEMLERVPVESLPSLLDHRLRLRRAVVWSKLAFERERAGRHDDARNAAAQAVSELLRVPRPELAESDADTYTEAAVRAAIVRPAVEVAAAARGRIQLERAVGADGQTCLRILDATAASTPLVERCTYGVVWPASARSSSNGKVLTVAVQPLEDWRELWVFHKGVGAWTVDVLSPAPDPGVGYVEWAGFTPDGQRLLTAREARVAGRFARSFDVVRLDTVAVEGHAAHPRDLTPFHRWQSPEWKGQTLALR